MYVIDSGREKQKSYDAMSHSSSLRVQWISKASANQRKGRAGRLRNGFVYRVYSSDRYQSMLDTALPELLRTSLTEICLQTKLMIKETLKVEEFLLKCITPPSLASVRQSIKLLQSLGALDQSEQLTKLGSYLAQMPVDAKYGKMLIYAISLKCLDPILTIVSVLSMSDQVFVLPTRAMDRHKCDDIRRIMSDGTMSDHYFMLKIFEQWSNQKGYRNERRFCEEHFVSSSSMEHVRGIRSQIISYLQKSDLLNASPGALNLNSNRWPMIKACLCAGLYPSVARIDRSKNIMFSDIDQKLKFHMSSIMNKTDSTGIAADWVVFEEKNRVGSMSMIRCNTLVNSFSLSLAAGASLKSILEQSYHDDQHGESVFKIDNLVTFSASPESGSLMLNLRRQLDAMITRFVAQCTFKHNQNDDKLVQTIAKLLDIEEKNSGFVDPTVVNDKPFIDNWRPESNTTSSRQQPFDRSSMQQPYDRSNNRQSSFDQSRNNPRAFDKSNGNQSYQKQFNPLSEDQARDHQRAFNQSNGNQSYQKQFKPLSEDQSSNKATATTFFANNAPGGSRKSAKHFSKAFNQPRNNQPKYLAMKMNSASNIRKWAQSIALDIKEFNLKASDEEKLNRLVWTFKL